MGKEVYSDVSLLLPMTGGEHVQHMSLLVRKPVFGGFRPDPTKKPGCTTTVDGWRLEILYVRSRGIVLSV